MDFQNMNAHAQALVQSLHSFMRDAQGGIIVMAIIPPSPHQQHSHITTQASVQGSFAPNIASQPPPFHPAPPQQNNVHLSNPQPPSLNPQPPMGQFDSMDDFVQNLVSNSLQN